MGGCCEAHLITEVNEHIKLGHTAVVWQANPNIKGPTCYYCKAKVAYFVGALSE